MGMSGIKLSTAEDVCERANKIDSGLHDKEKSKFSFYFYWLTFCEKVSAKLNLIFRW